MAVSVEEMSAHVRTKPGFVWTRLVVVAATGLLLAAVVGWTTPSPVAAQTPSWYETTYRPDVEAEVVDVETIFTLGLRRGPLFTFVPGDAIDIESDLPISVTADPDLFYQEVRIDTGAAAGDQAGLRYRLPSAEPRSGGDTRVNRAHISFFVSADPFLPDGAIRIVIPDGFRADIDPSLMRPTVGGDGAVVWVADPVPDPESFFFRLLATNDDGLTRTTVTFDDQSVTIAAWADDPVWLDFATEQVEDGIPMLVDLIDQPWPQDDLVVIESAAPALEGYAGWFSLRESEIEVGDQLDQVTMLHELSHAWFNDVTLAERWIIEGLAEEFSARAADVLGGTPPETVEPGAAPPALDGLANWRSRFYFEDTWDIELYGYTASAYVMRQLSEEIGVDGLAVAIDALFDGQMVYAVEGEPAVHPPNDWRRFLDVLELEAGSANAEALFAEYVVPSDQQSLLASRRSAQRAYDAFVVETSDLGVPVGVRQSMSRWQFGSAIQQMDRAREVVDDLDLLAARSAALGVSPPSFIADLYRTSNGSFVTVSTAVDQANEALDAIEARGLDAATFDRDQVNFELGRLDLIDEVVVDAEQLNQSTGSGPNYGAYLAVIGALAIALLGVGVAAARLSDS